VSEKEKGRKPKSKAERTALTERTIEHALATGTLKGDDYKLPEAHKWSGLWKVFAGIGALGLAGAGAGYATDPTRFAFAWLFAFIAVLTIAIGAMMFVLIQHLVSAAWSVVVRRIAEIFGSGVPVFLLLFVPIAISMPKLYPWLDHGGHGSEGGEEHAQVTPSDAAKLDLSTAVAQAEKAGGHGAAAGAGAKHETATDAPKAVVGATEHAIEHGGRPDPDHVTHMETLAKKAPWLNRNGFLVRAMIYLLLWTALGTLLLRNSAKQDKTRDPAATVRAAKMSSLGIILLAFSLTFAAFDWLMSLEPTWYSTIFGVIFFASSIVSQLATLIVVLFHLRKTGFMEKEVTIEHFHDLGKLMFGFLVFWAYVSFSQFMLIWYASIPEEVTFYHHRWGGGAELWKTVSLALVGLHFVLPFFFVLSRNVKRRPELLQWGAIIILVMHVVEAYWAVLPYAPQHDFGPHWMDLACLLGVAGCYLAVVFWNMSRYPLLPVGDPRLARSLHFMNA
jgi:hypothetical protein